MQEKTRQKMPALCHLLFFPKAKRKYGKLAGLLARSDLGAFPGGGNEL